MLFGCSRHYVGTFDWLGEGANKVLEEPGRWYLRASPLHPLFHCIRIMTDQTSVLFEARSRDKYKI